MAENAVFDVQGLCFSYGEDPVLENLSLRIEPGLFHTVVGPNGCGKTTLVDLLMGRKKPAAGAVRFRERGIRTYGKRTLARSVALVPQDFQVYFDFTVREVVSMGRHPFVGRFGKPSRDDGRIVEEVMRETGVIRFSDRFVTELSGGEKQRVVFARALAQDSEVLILDEATSNMDIRYTLELLDLVLKRVREKGHTVLAVMHDLALASLFSDRIVFMKEGKVFTQGDTKQVLGAGNIRDVFGVEADIHEEPADGSRHVIFKRRRVH